MGGVKQKMATRIAWKKVMKSRLFSNLLFLQLDSLNLYDTFINTFSLQTNFDSCNNEIFW